MEAKRRTRALARKLKGQKGETLVELMASIIVATLSVALLFSCVSAAVQMGRATVNTDTAHYAALSAAEAQNGTAVGTVTVTVKRDGIGTGQVQYNNVPVYGDEAAGIYSYRYRP